MFELAVLNDSLALLPDTTFSVPGRADAAKTEHEAILAAIEMRDPLTAEQAACMHIQHALEGRLMLCTPSRRPARRSSRDHWFGPAHGAETER
ncbi:MAG: FCD domain-containing protein [Hoeflea sp.]|nr:FCD domain-containing protein [Hoeflea sp.]